MQLLPGDLVFLVDRYDDTGFGVEPGIVVAVYHRREGSHMGCEDRFNVFCSIVQKFVVVCDCRLLRAEEMPG